MTARVLDGLRATGWVVAEHAVAGAWPRPDGAALAASGRRRRHRAPARAAPRSTASWRPAPTASSCRQRRPACASSSSSTCRSGCARSPCGRGGAARPHGGIGRRHDERLGARRAARRVRPRSGCRARRAPGRRRCTVVGGHRRTATRLLCVAAVTALKGHADLVAALALVADLPWSCVVAGALDREPDVVGRAPGPARDGGADRSRAPRRRPARRRPPGGVCRRRPPRAALPRRDVRDGRDRGARARSPGGRDRRRWSARGPG